MNVHTGDFSNGAIRSQLSSGAFAVATGANESPGPGDTDGLGMGVFTLSGGTTLTYNAPRAEHRGSDRVAHSPRRSRGTGPVVITLANSYPGDRATGYCNGPPDVARRDPRKSDRVLFQHSQRRLSEWSDSGPGRHAALRGAGLLPDRRARRRPNGTRFVADVRVVNGTSAPSTATLEFFPSTPAGLSAASVTRGVIVAPGEELVVNDVVSSQFSTTGLGALKVGLADP